ncbi:MAG: hypothetical protein KGN33_09490 [Paracoccaceae bacterium]|nr:hypothetical protein [Paracoccaceae bacterium]
MAKLKVKLQAHHHILIHNDLANVAHRFKTTVDKRLELEDREGISLEIMAALAFIAFTTEARLNFIGFKIFGDKWGERENPYEKVRNLCKVLNLSCDFGKRPFKTMEDVQRLRNGMAHGKPIELQVDETIEVDEDDLEELGAIRPPEWEGLVTADFLNLAYEDCDRIWKTFLNAAGLTVFDTLTRAQVSTSLIERISGDA